MLDLRKIIFIALLLSGCSSFSDVGQVMRNEKIKTTDEFLVKKRDPLSLPPDYSEIPKPGSISASKKIDEDSKKIEKLFKIKNEKGSSNSSSKSVEDSVLKQIGK